MVKQISTEFSNSLQERVTRPGWLVYVGFSTPLYLASYADTYFDGQNWQRADVDVRKISQVQGGGLSAAIELGNGNNIISAYVLNEGVSDKEVVIYKAYYDENGSFIDAKGCFKGVGESADLSNIVSVVINAQSVTPKNLFSPRLRVCRENGFHYLLRPGMVLSWGKTTVVLE